MPNKRNAVGSPSRAIGKKRRTANRTGGQIMQNEEITQKKDVGAGRRRIAKKKQGVGHVVAEGPVETTDFSSGNESKEDARAFTSLRHDPLHKNFEIANNSIDFTPSQESSIHDTVGEHVPFKIKEKIWEGKFIELHSLLRTQKAMEEVDEGDLKLKRGKICIEKRSSSVNLSINEWTSAFMVFMSVYIEKYCTRAQELLKYMRDIRLAATRSENWATYDEQFRLKIEKNPNLSWGNIHEDGTSTQMSIIHRKSLDIMENWNEKLCKAAREGGVEDLELCLANGANINHKSHGATALVFACMYGQLEVCRKLIAAGCDINITVNEGGTALHIAAARGYLKVTKYLVEKGGFNPSVKTDAGKTPYDLAGEQKERQYKEVMEYLKILDKIRQLNENDFKNLVALGTFASYENRVYLAGPSNIGKSSLASILIDEPIPKTWFSTDGLIIHFGRNGIDLEHRKMIPLKKRSGDVLMKLLLGNPKIKKNKSLPDKSKEETQRDLNSSSEQTSSGGQEQMAYEFNQETPKDIHKPPIHTAHTIYDDLLEKIKQETDLMNIAPSDLVDFGGQKSFDMTHQLFIQQRGTFILMFDGRKGLDTKLEDVTAASILQHWINSVLTYCNTTKDQMPRIVFAATHSDSFSEDEKKELAVAFQKELTEQFSSHKLQEHIQYKKVFFINATDAADLEIYRLKDTLVNIAFQQSTWGQHMPIVWVPLDLQIADMRADGVKLITKERLLKINQSNKEFALYERTVEDFLLFQHSIGKLLYYDQPVLRDFVVIQPSAMVNILRAFITDILFWPENGPIRDILENLSSTGVLKKKDLFTLWSQPAFRDILTNDRIKDYVVLVLLHLDILVEPKRYSEKEAAADLFLVPCMVNSKIPLEIQNVATDDRTICIAYHLKETVVPPALSFKLIGAAISIWPLKVVDTRYCLYFQAAILDADNRNELQIHVKGPKIIVYLINEVAKQNISPDLATTTQECLTLALGRILEFYSHCFGKESHQVMSDVFEIEVGEICSGEPCLIPLSEAKKQTHWICNNGHTHETKYPLNWVVDKNKEHCDQKCKGLGEDTKTLLLKPNEKHFVHLTKKLEIGDFYNFFIHLGMSKADYDTLNFRYFSNPMDMMLMGMFQWRDKTESDQSSATFGKLLEALQAIDREHYLCQVQREDHSLVEKAHSRLQVVPSDEVINALTEKDLIGDCVVHLGIELGLTIVNIRKTMYKFPRDLDGQIHDLLIKWKEIDRVKPTIYRLMVALKRVEAAEGLAFLKETYDVE